MRRIKLIDLELSRPLNSVQGLDGYGQLQALLRWHGHPIGSLKIPVHGDRCSNGELGKAIVQEHAYAIAFHLLHCAMRSPGPANGWTLNDLFNFRPSRSADRLPTITVAVCTRDRTESLANCLKALAQLDCPPLEILVIDNAPRTTATRDLLAKDFPCARYMLEPRPGLNWARNRAIAEARGEIIAYADDDVVVDSGWTKALATIFNENPHVMAVTGLVVPFELETEAQLFFEENGGFGRGFTRKWYRAEPGEKIGWEHGGAGKFGTGANMAYRRRVFFEVGNFDPALDVGTVTQGGGDLEMFFRVLKSGHALVYEPAAIVRHQHRRDFAALETQIASNGIGFYSHLISLALAYPEERRGLSRLAVWWFWTWNLRRWLRSFIRPSQLPRKLLWAELRGSVIGLFRYQKARRNLAG